MEIKTKFGIADKVFIIHPFSEEYFEKCSTCEGSGNIKIKDNEYTCPECSGFQGKTKRKTKQWDIYNNGKTDYVWNKVVNIRVEVTKKEIEIKYILGYSYDSCYSGNLWCENNLFSTVEEAQKECDKRNQTLNKQGDT